MKVVLDTNVYLSEALLGRVAGEVITAARQGVFTVFISDYILEEIADVLGSPKFQATPRFIHLTVRRASRLSKTVRITGKHMSRVADLKDHPVVETAVNCAADYLVTGDGELLTLRKIDSVEVISLADFLSMLRNLGKI